MAKYKIFVSGVQKELGSERRTVKDYILDDVLLSEYFDVFLFEDFPAKNKPAEKAYLEELRKSDIYIGVLGQCYGSGSRENLSPTELEFRQAKKLNKNILFYIKGESSRDKSREVEMQRFIKEIKNPKHGFSYKRFSDNFELGRHIYASLIDFLKNKGIVGRGVFDERVCSEATLKDIDDGKIRWFLNIAKNERKFPLSSNTPARDILTHLNLMQNGRFTNAAILLFGKTPHKFFLQAEIKCLQLFGTEIKKPFNYKIYNGNLFDQVDKAVAFVLDILKQAVIQQEHTSQFKRPFEIPVFAIQEAIVNAVAHRNYNVSSSVQVMVFSDRVEIWNSGSLPPELEIEDLRKPHTSYPANPLLAHVLYLADYIQQAGSGTLEMIEQCRNQGSPEPRFELIRNVEFRIILPRNIFTEENLRKLGINARQLKAVKYALENRSINNQIYQELNKITKRTASRDLTDLVHREIFRKSGITGKGTWYQLRNFSGAGYEDGSGEGSGSGSGRGFGDGSGQG